MQQLFCLDRAPFELYEQFCSNDTGYRRSAIGCARPPPISHGERTRRVSRRDEVGTARQIASRLRPFGIVPGTKRDGGDTFKGYKISQFNSAFSRYLASSSVTPSQPALQSHFPETSSVTNEAGGIDPKTPKPTPHNACDAVTNRNGDNSARVWTKPTFAIIRHDPNGRDHGYV